MVPAGLSAYTKKTLIKINSAIKINFNQSIMDRWEEMGRLILKLI